MLDTVLGGDSTVGAAFWDAVTALGLPRAGEFAVIATVAVRDHSAEDATPDIEALVAAHPGVEEAWFRLKPRAQLGVVSFRRNRGSALDDLAVKIAARLPVWIGLSSPFPAVAECVKACTQAQVAARACSATRPTIRYNRDVLSVLMASSPDAATTVVSATLGPVLALPPERRELLIETVRTWLRRGQSVSATAAEMHCHRNTVVYHRFSPLCRTDRTISRRQHVAGSGGVGGRGARGNRVDLTPALAPKRKDGLLCFSTVTSPQRGGYRVDRPIRRPQTQRACRSNNPDNEESPR